jgi:proton-translocating NAD(P)+ transhydrogenase subunit alpha
MNDLLTNSLFIFVLAAFLGFEVIRRVPKLLHTPLMSFTNALSAIALVGSLVLAGANEGTLATTLGVIAVTASTINAVGGFLITDRMLRMFKRKDDRPAAAAPAGDGQAAPKPDPSTKAAP